MFKGETRGKVLLQIREVIRDSDTYALSWILKIWEAFRQKKIFTSSHDAPIFDTEVLILEWFFRIQKDSWSKEILERIPEIFINISKFQQFYKNI